MGLSGTPSKNRALVSRQKGLPESSQADKCYSETEHTNYSLRCTTTPCKGITRIENINTLCGEL